jgi:hypothetical protein
MKGTNINIYILMSIPMATAMSINMNTNIMSIPAGMRTANSTAMSTTMRIWSTCMSMRTQCHFWVDGCGFDPLGLLSV